MARSQNPMEAFRREQKKKELKKNQVQRQREKQAKLHDLDVDEIRDRLKKLERQVQQNPADGPTRKRKQELEDTLNAALKKQKAMEDEEKEKEAAAKSTMTLADINAANRERYQNPENSIYYHPVLNPYGAPPPGQPQRYRVPPPKPEPKPQSGRRQSQGGLRVPGPPQPSAVRRVISGRPQRPGKRPPLPPGPPPPGTIQVPARPPLPSAGNASVSHQPPPPPPPPTATLGLAPRAPPPPPPLPQATTVPNPTHGDVDMEHRGVVDVYPPLNDADVDDAVSTRLYEDHEEDGQESAEQQQRLRSLVPTTVRVQRPAKPKALAPSVPRPPPPPPPGPSLPVVAAPAPPATKPNDATSEYDAFMEEMKSLGAV